MLLGGDEQTNLHGMDQHLGLACFSTVFSSIQRSLARWFMTCDALHWPPGQSKAPSIRHGTIHRHSRWLHNRPDGAAVVEAYAVPLAWPGAGSMSTCQHHAVSMCAWCISLSPNVCRGGKKPAQLHAPATMRRRTHCAPWRSSSHWVWFLSCDEAEQMANGARGSKNLDREAFRICIGILIQIVLLSSVALCQAET